MKSASLVPLGWLLAAAMAAGCQNPSEPASPSDTGPVVPALVLDAPTLTFDTPDLTKTLSPTVTGASAGTITWTSSNPYVATVSPAGAVKSVSGGEAVIMATLPVAGSSALTAACTVTVSEPVRTKAAAFTDPASVTGGPVSILLCGDSTMRTYEPNPSDQTGWGQVLSEFLTGDVAVNNAIANGGRSSRSFYNEPGRWDQVKTLLAAATAPTYVFLQFGHNDQKKVTDSAGADYLTFARTNQNGTTAGTFYDYLERYIVEARALGGIPVLFTPFVRAYLEGGSVTVKGQHNIADPYPGETAARGDYAAAMKEVGAKHQVPVIDLTAASKAFVEAYAAAGALNHLYISGDQTHERSVGALLLAQAAVAGLKAQGILANHVKAAGVNRFQVDTGSLAFGSINVGTTKDQSFLVSGFGDASGTATFTAPAGYAVSTDGTTFGPTATLTCPAGWKGASVTVRFGPTAAGSVNGALTVSHSVLTPSSGNTVAPATPGTILLTGVGKEAVAGAAASVTWPLAASGAVTYEGTPAGALSAAAATLSGLALKSLVTLGDGTVIPRFTTTATDLAAGSWPAESARNPARYLQFTVPVGPSAFNLDAVALTAGSNGGSTVKWDIVYSLTEDFAAPVELALGQGGASGALVPFSQTGMGVPVPAGTTFYLRVYPYNTLAASGKALMIRDVTVSGVTP